MECVSFLFKGGGAKIREGAVIRSFTVFGGSRCITEQ